jgi:hypothetical protein
MTHATPQRIADEERKRREDSESACFRAALEADEPAASAEQFHITDLQHWIDLSA